MKVVSFRPLWLGKVLCIPGGSWTEIRKLEETSVPSSYSSTPLFREMPPNIATIIEKGHPIKRHPPKASLNNKIAIIFF